MKDELLRRIDTRPRLSSGDATNTVIIGGANADMVDGIDADRVPRPNKLLALGADAKFTAEAIPWPSAEGVHGYGGRTIFGPGATHLAEDIDAAQTTITVYERVWGVDEYLLLQPALGPGEKMKITAGPEFIGTNRHRYTVTRNADALGAQSFNKGQVVVSIGKVHQGYIAIDAQGHKEFRPFIDIIERTTDSANGTTLRARLGKLDGITENGIDLELAPRGWGIWTDNGYFRGTLRVRGSSRIDTELAVGYPLGPEMRIRRRALPNGQTVHGMEWLYEPNRRWWVQWFNETNRRVYWSVRKPSTEVSPEEDLITLQYRQGDATKGEPLVQDYFLNINARTVIGDLIASRLHVLGYLSSMVAEFGEIATGAIRIASATYEDAANRNGWYAWRNYQPWVQLGSTLGFEFWRSGVLQGKWDNDLGALIFGPESVDGRLYLRRSTMGFDVLPMLGWRGVGDGGAPGFYWWEKETDAPMARMMHGRRQQVSPTTGEYEEIERSVWLEAFYKSANISNGLNLASYGPDDATTARLVLGGGATGGRLSSALLQGDSLTLQSSSLGVFMRARAGEMIEFGNLPVSFYQSFFLPPPLTRVTVAGSWGAGQDESGYVTLAAYASASGLLRLALDPATQNIKVKVGNNAWRTVTTS